MANKRPINPETLCAPIGFAHAYLVEAGDSRTLYLAGQCGHNPNGKILHTGDLVGQTTQALENIGAILSEARMEFSDIVQLNFYVTSRDDYATARRDLGAIWRKHFDRHFPAMAVVGVTALYDPDALIEIQGIAAR